MTPSAGTSLLARWQLAKAASTDGRLSRSNIAVLISILDRLNGGTGEAWPGKAAIAKDALVHEATAKDGVRRLVALGYLARESGGKGQSNRYRIGTAPTGGELATSRRVAPPRRCESASPVGVKRLRKGGVNPGPEHTELNLLNEPAETNLLKTGGFAGFWLAYPKKVSKPAAEKAWRAKKLDTKAAEIIADLTARTATGGPWKFVELRYVPNPATYLNNERWKDEWRQPSKAELPRDERSEDEIAAENDAALVRIGGGHG